MGFTRRTIGAAGAVASAAMEAIVLCGLQGAGKTTLYRDRWLETHVRISMDLLRTRAREAALLELCLSHAAAVRGRQHQPDGRRPARATSSRRGRPASGSSATSSTPTPREALGRNAGRSGRARVPDRGVLGTAKRLIRPAPEEGFDELWHAAPAPGGGWRIEPLVSTEPLF